MSRTRPTTPEHQDPETLRAKLIAKLTPPAEYRSPSWYEKLRRADDKPPLGPPRRLPKGAQRLLVAFHEEDERRYLLKLDPSELAKAAALFGREPPDLLDREKQIAARVADIAKKTDADPQRIWDILWFKRDLEYLVGKLLKEQLALERKAAAAAAVYETLARHGWPWRFHPDHPFDREAVLRLVALANRDLDRIRRQRRDRGISKSPRSKSFRTVKAVAVVGRVLARYLTDCMLTPSQRAFRERVRQGLTRPNASRPYYGEDSYRTDSQYFSVRAARYACELLKCAFPTVAGDLTAARLKGRLPKKKP
jgi:hypothetical protein